MLDAIIVIAQYARDQAMVAHVTKQLKYRCAVWITITENTHSAFVWSLRRTVSSCRIAILHLSDNYNRRIGRVRNEKNECHRFSGIASQRVEWVDPNIEQVNREAPSPSFLQEKQKHLELRGWS